MTAYNTMKIWPWENKIEKVIFRGLITGINWDYIPYPKAYPEPKITAEEMRDILMEHP